MEKERDIKFEILRTDEFQECLEEKAGFLSKLVFSWTGHIIEIGNKKLLQESDLCDIRKEEKIRFTSEKFRENLLKTDRHGKPISYHYALYLTIRGTFLATFVMSILSCLLLFPGPLIIGKILDYLNNDKDRGKPGWQEIPMYEGWVWAAILALSNFVRLFINQHSMHLLNRLSIMISNCITSSIYEKVLNMNCAARRYEDAGKIMNLVNVDSSAVYQFCGLATQMVTAPLTIILSLLFICLQIGPIGLIGPVLLGIAILLQNRVQRKSFEYRKMRMQYTDKRSKALNEFISAMKVIKYYAWEKVVFKKIQDIRKNELGYIQKNIILNGLMEVISTIIPIFTLIAVFGIYAGALGGEFGPAKAFSVLSLFNVMLFPLRMIGSLMIQFASAKASMKRIEHFAKSEERTGDEVTLDELSEFAVQIDQASFGYETDYAKKHHEEGKLILSSAEKGIQKKLASINDDKAAGRKDSAKDSRGMSMQAMLKQPLLENDSSENLMANSTRSRDDSARSSLSSSLVLPGPKLILNNLSFSCRKGEFVVVVGQVGAGKSSFLQAILGEMIKHSGSVAVSGHVAYVPQTAWLMNASVRDNILFGREYEELRYKVALKVCELEQDLDVFPGGDLTEIGERGVNLSGGQKQRVSLARALYDNADIYLIDDCLSALDSHVGKVIFDNVFKGVLRGKTIIMVTHTLIHAPKADRLVVFKNGAICEEGTFASLMENPESEFSRLNVQFEKKKRTLETEQLQALSLKNPSSKKTSEKKEEVKKLSETDKSKKGGLIKVEERAEGSVKWAVYKEYLTAAGAMSTWGTFLTFAFTQILRVMNDWWLGVWSLKQFGLSTEAYIAIFCALSVATALLVNFRVRLFGKWAAKTAQSFQERLLHAILKSPMFWFDITPNGRILSRTTKDQDSMDVGLPWMLMFISNQLVMLFSSVLISGIANPLYFAIAFVSGIFYTWMVGYYINAARETKRIESVARAPLISHIGETINGVYTIRAFGKSRDFKGKLENRNDRLGRALQNSRACGRWIAFRSEIFFALLMATTSFLGVLSRTWDFMMDPALIGLALSYSLRIGSTLSFLIQTLATVESQMSSVERIQDYIHNNPAERDFDSPKAPADWPSEGKFHVENLTYRYRAGLENVIHGISFSINRHEKIGVIGRTGSGKSTLTLGILRILELVEDPTGKLGKIEIDGADISEMGLHELRKRITIIPQDPMLFTDTIRFNIDPFNEMTDAEIVDALKKTQIWDSLQISDQNLRGTLQETEEKLSLKVTEGGNNFSLGQRQLLCMARALIRKPKVLLLDEATASIDELTDHFIQKMLKTEFSSTTVITIAHRINTIIQYDKIMVLDKGKIMEFDTPETLLDNERSYLSSLVKEQGQEFMDRMRFLAKNKNIDPEVETD